MKKIYLKSMSDYIYNQIRKPEIFFTFFASLVGVVFVFLVPPMQVPDEQTHFFQSYAVSNFDFIPTRFEKNDTVHYGPKLPISIHNAAIEFREDVAGNPAVKSNPDLLKKYIAEDLEPQKTEFVDGTVYPPFVYLPQAIGITIGKVFDASPLIMIWLGRLVNLLIWILIVFISIKILPFGKWILAILALNPVALFLSASMSADVMTIGLSFFLFALIASTLTKKYVITKTKIALIITVVSVLMLTKPTSILLAGLLFVIPVKAFSNKWKYLLFCIGTILFGLSIYLFWSFLSIDTANAISQLQRPGLGVDSNAQLSFVLTNPIDYVKYLLQNYVFVLPGYPGDAVLKSAIGTLGWLDTPIPLWTIVMYVMTLLFAVLYETGKGIYLNMYQKGVLVAVGVLYCLATVSALYLFYTPVRGSMVSGVQGRYFIPISIILLGIFSTKQKLLDVKERTFVGIILGSLIIILAMVILKIFLRYY
jgi:uncharacterized membrane protein